MTTWAPLFCSLIFSLSRIFPIDWNSLSVIRAVDFLGWPFNWSWAGGHLPPDRHQGYPIQVQVLEEEECSKRHERSCSFMFTWMCIGCEQLLLVLSFLPCFSYPLSSPSWTIVISSMSHSMVLSLSLSQSESQYLSSLRRRPCGLSLSSLQTQRGRCVGPPKYKVTCPTLQRKNLESWQRDWTRRPDAISASLFEEHGRFHVIWREQ